MCVCVCFPLNYYFKSTFPLGIHGTCVYLPYDIYPSKSSWMHGAVNIQYPCHGLTHGFLVSPENSKLGGRLKDSLFFILNTDPWGFMIQVDVAHIFQMGWKKTPTSKKLAGFRSTFLARAAKCLGVCNGAEFDRWFGRSAMEIKTSHQEPST